AAPARGRHRQAPACGAAFPGAHRRRRRYHGCRRRTGSALQRRRSAADLYRLHLSRPCIDPGAGRSVTAASARASGAPGALSYVSVRALVIRRGNMKRAYLVLALALVAPAAIAAEPLSNGDTAWVLTSTALVLFMTIPGLSLFYGGLVRSRNVL